MAGFGISASGGERASAHGPAHEAVEVLAEVARSVAVGVELAQGVLAAHALSGLGSALQTHFQGGLGASTHDTLAGHGSASTRQATDLTADDARQGGVQHGSACAVEVGVVAQLRRAGTGDQFWVLIGSVAELTGELALVHEVWDAEGRALSHPTCYAGQEAPCGRQPGGHGHRVGHRGQALPHLTSDVAAGVAQTVHILDPAHRRCVSPPAQIKALDLLAQSVRPRHVT